MMIIEDTIASETKKGSSLKERIVKRLEIKADNLESSEGFTILGIKPWRLMAYFAIYSFFGYLIETVYGVLTKGVVESCKSFLYGPFCGIYGFGAVVMILLLQFFKKNNVSLFYGGFFIGSIVEYFTSFFGELLFHVRWWDYSTQPFNINGRVCAFYSIAWGLLAIFLMKVVNPRVDKFIVKTEKKIPKCLLPVVAELLTVFLIFDALISVYALNVFYSRIVYEFDIDIENKTYYTEYYDRILNNKKKELFLQKFFSNEKMLITYPNLKIQDINGNTILVKDLLKEITPYYVRLYYPDKSIVPHTN